MILGWFEGPRLEIMKWLRTDKQTDRQTEFQLVDSTPVGGVEWKTGGAPMIALKRATSHQLWTHLSNIKANCLSQEQILSGVWLGIVQHGFNCSPWNLRILFVSSSAQVSLFTSNVGYKSCSFSTSSQELSLSMTSHCVKRCIFENKHRKYCECCPVSQLIVR